MPTLLGALLCSMFAAFALLGFRVPLPMLLAIGAALPASAVIVIAGQSLSPFFAVAVVAAAAAALHASWPSRGAVAFCAWSLFMTALGPAYFHRTAVLAPRGGIDAQISSPSRLSYSVSNLAQACYLVLGVAVVAYLSKRGRAQVLGLTFWTGGLLSSARFIVERLGIAWPSLFDSTSVAYVDSQYDGATRLRGVFAEPSELASFEVSATAYFVARSMNATNGRGRAQGMAGALLSLALLSQSYSGTAVVATALMAAAWAVWAVARFTVGASGIPRKAVFLILTGSPLAILLGSPVTSFARDLVRDKAASGSFAARSLADRIGFDVAIRSHLLGVGLGSNRPSSFAVMLLSCVGIPGLLLFTALVIVSAVRASRSLEGRPVAAALAALLAAKVTASPDLSTPLLWLCIGLCLSPGVGKLNGRHRDVIDVDGAATDKVVEIEM